MEHLHCSYTSSDWSVPSEATKSDVFPSFRGMQEASSEMHPIEISTCDAQALPGYVQVGIKITPHGPEALVRWLVL